MRLSGQVHSVLSCTFKATPGKWRPRWGFPYMHQVAALSLKALRLLAESELKPLHLREDESSHQIQVAGVFSLMLTHH